MEKQLELNAKYLEARKLYQAQLAEFREQHENTSLMDQVDALLIELDLAKDYCHSLAQIILLGDTVEQTSGDCSE